MKCTFKATGICLLMSLCAFVDSNRLRGQTVDGQQLRVNLVGFADRWADYGSRGDTPSFRDFLAVHHQGVQGKRPHDVFIKLRFLYWPQDKSDPKSLSENGQQERVLNAKRDSPCDETFASLSHKGDVSYLDPQLKPSRFMHLRGNTTNLPPPQATLPCYEVKTTGPSGSADPKRGVAPVPTTR